jgi:ferritin
MSEAGFTNSKTMDKDLEKAVNRQIQIEFQSAYGYLALSGHMDARGLKGVSHWLRLQWEEELAHAMKFFDHVLARGGQVQLKSLETPEIPERSVIDHFSGILEKEQSVTQSINELYALAVSHRDYPLQTLLHWFIDEQVEEEESVRDIIDQLNMAGDSGPGLFFVDRELSDRQKGEADAEA